MTEINLPESVLQQAELVPVEDILLYALRQGLPGMPVFSKIPEDPPAHGFVLVRKDFPMGYERGDERFLGTARAFINTFTVDPDGDSKGAIVSDACRVVLRDAWMKNLYVPGCGWIRRITNTHSPTRVTDWATSAGPVQYADLPTGFWRYESKYLVSWRRELGNPFS